MSPLLSLAPAAYSALLVQIAAAHHRPDDEADLAEIVSSKTFDALSEARTAGTAKARVLWWPAERNEEGRTFLRDLIADFGMDDDKIDVLTAGLAEGAASPEIIVPLLPQGMAAPLIERLRKEGVANSLYGAVLNALHQDRPEELGHAAHTLQPEAFDLQLAAVLAPTEPDIAFLGADAAYESMSGPSRDALLAVLEQFATATHLPIVERFAFASGRSERARRARAFVIAGRLVPSGLVPDYLTEGVRVQDSSVSAAAFEAIGTLKPRDPQVLRDLRDMARTDGKIARPAASTLDALTDGFAAELRGSTTTAQRCELLTLLGAAARPKAIDLLLDHLGDAEWDDIGIHRAAAMAVLEAVPFLKITTAQLERLGELLDGETQESDPPVREMLASASETASLGPDDALNLLYEMARIRPKASPDELFGFEKMILVRQLGLYKRELDRGDVGHSTAISHLDNVAERIVRAAYVRLGSSEDIKRRIQQSPRDPDYGHVLKSLGAELDKARNGFGRLHEIRSDETEVPHPGKPMTDASWTAAQEGFAHAANVCLAAIDAAIAVEA